MKAIAIFCLGLMFSSAYCAETKFPVYLNHECVQPKSSRFIFEVKEAIRASSMLSLTEQLGQTIEQIRLVCVDTEYGVAYSMVRTFPSKEAYPYYAGHFVGICGENAMAECARNVLADVSNGVDETLKMIREGFKPK